MWIFNYVTEHWLLRINPLCYVKATHWYLTHIETDKWFSLPHPPIVLAPLVTFLSWKLVLKMEIEDLGLVVILFECCIDQIKPLILYKHEF